MPPNLADSPTQNTLRFKREFSLGNCRVIPAECAIQCDQTKTSLQPKQIEVLCYLAEQYPKVISRNELIEQVWESNAYVGEKALTNTIWNLRKHLAESADGEAIETIRKVGYRLMIEPKWFEEQQDSAQPAPAEINQSTSASLTKILLSGISIVLTLVLFFVFYNQPQDITEKKLQLSSITTEPGRELYPSPSPDGRYLAFVWIKPDGTRNLYMKDTQKPALAPVKLTFSNATVRKSVWAADSQSIYYSSINRTQRTCQVNKLNVISRTQENIADCGAFTRNNYISLSPDGKLLAFSARYKKRQRPGIYTLDLTNEQAHPKRFSCHKKCNYAEYDMAFSPDSKLLAVTRRFNRFNEDAFLIDISSGKTTQVTFGEADIVGINWHPDGEHITYGVRRADLRTGFIYDVTSKQSRQLDIEGFSFPVYDKQGDKLFFHQRKERYHIAQLPLDNNQTVTPFPVIESQFSHKDPDYSNVTQQIVYTSNVSGHYEVWLSDKDGTNAIQLTNLAKYASTPRWSNDGKKVAFISTTDDVFKDAIHVVDVATKQVETVKTNYGQHSHPTWDPEDNSLIVAIKSSDFNDLFRVYLDDTPIQRLTFDGGKMGFLNAQNQLIYTNEDVSLWQKSMPVSNAPIQLIPRREFGTFYTWALDRDGIFYRRKLEDGRSIYHMNRQTGDIKELIKLPKGVFDSLNNMAYIADSNSLLFTMEISPQADIKVIELH